MLYVSTRGSVDTYTAHRALCEARTPDGGFHLPFHQPTFSDEELSAIKAQPVGNTIAQLLNLFFGLRLTGWDVDCVIGRTPFQTESLGQRITIGEIWHNPGNTADYLIENLYALITGHKGKNKLPHGWAYVAIEISLLFGLYAALETVPEDGFDIAVCTGDFSHIVAVQYARKMGLPIHTILCICNENSGIWDLFNKGELYTGATVVKTDMPELDTVQPMFLEYFIALQLGSDEVHRYLEACDKTAFYRIDELQLESLHMDIFSAVVSANRAHPIASGIYRTNAYSVDPYTALAYGGLQDYRAKTGISKDTLIVARSRAK